jgi:hypothetical protein
MLQQQQHRPLHDEVPTPFKERAAPFQIEDENVTQTNKKKLGGGKEKHISTTFCRADGISP